MRTTETRKRTVIGSRFSRQEYESKTGLWLPIMNVVVVRERYDKALRRIFRDIFWAENIVTDAGDLHYAQRIVSEALTNAFDTLELQSAGTPSKTANRSNFTSIASTQKLVFSGYPLRDDTDADNTGAGVDIVTHKFSYTKADFNAAGITHGIITNTGPAAAEPILTGFAFAASFAKTADDTLKVFVNHTVLGV